ncbi:putative ribonuclease H-like domain-containing protein [Tanacetum coccineum]
MQRVNKQNQFVPSAVLTRTSIIPVNTSRSSGTKNFSTVRQSVNRQTVLTSTAMKVNTVKHIVNRVRPANVFNKTHSSSTRPFKKTTLLRPKFSNQKFNTAKVNAVSTVGGKRETAVKPSTGCNWRLQRYHGGSKYNSGSILGNLDVPGVTPSNLSMQRNVEYPKALHYWVNSTQVIFTSKEFKNKDVIKFCGSKGIKREYSNARTPQQNGVAERKNRTLIEAARTMLADSFFINSFGLLTTMQVTRANKNAGTEDTIDALDYEKEDESTQDCFVLPIWPSYSSKITPALKTDDKREGPREEEQVFMDDLERLKRQEKEANEEAKALRKKFEQQTENLVIQEGVDKHSSTNIFSTVSTPAKASSTNLVNTVSIPVSTASPHEGLSLSDPTNPEEDDSEIPPLEDIYQNSTDGIFTTSSYDDEGAVADFTNLETIVNVSPIPTSRIHSSHPSSLILGDPTLAVDAMQEELLQFKIQKVWILVDLPFGKKAIGTKWVYRNNKDERGVVVRNKARLVAQGHRQEEGIDYDESESRYVAENPKEKVWTLQNVKTASTPIETQKPLVKDEEASDVDVHLYRFQVTPKSSHLSVVKIIFRKSQQEVSISVAKRLFSWNAKADHWLLLLKKQRICFSLGSYHWDDSIHTVALVNGGIAMLFRNVTPLFVLSWYNPTEDAGVLTSERPSEAYPTPSPAHIVKYLFEPHTDSSPAHTSEVPIEQQNDPSPRPSPSTIIPDSIPEASGGNIGGHSSSDKSLSGNEGELTL